MKIDIYQIRILVLNIMVLGLLSSKVFAAVPVVTNVKASQRPDTKFVDITYDLADADGDKCSVRIEMSSNAGDTYYVPLITLTGDVGKGISPGTSKKIVWNAGEDWDGEFSDQMKVRISARDLKGFPGLEFGSEVKPGGFLMGQDGGAEGNGPSKQVNISWSYWMTKNKITCAQYAEFLNFAYTAGEIRIIGSKVVKLGVDENFNFIRDGATIASLGSDQLFWRINKFGGNNDAVLVTPVGALYFATYFGYDLPTSAEWEKAARGPDNQDAGTHLRFPWGNQGRNVSSSAGINHVNGYGLMDLAYTIAEWTRTPSINTVDYPSREVLNDDARLSDFYHSDNIIIRSPLHRSSHEDYLYKIRITNSGNYSFRVVRRNLD